MATKDLMNIGLVVDFILLDDPPLTSLPELANLSDNGKNPLHRKNDDFIPL